jgi:hypothetical protein
MSFDMFLIKYELEQLGLSLVVDLTKLADEASGEAYAKQIIGPCLVGPLEKDFLLLYLEDIRARLKKLVVHTRDESTPKKPRTNDRTPTPMTAPHQKNVSSSNPSARIIHLRDKTYAQMPLLGSHIYTPHRSTQKDVESDIYSIEKEIDKFRSQIGDPTLEKSGKENIFNQIYAFVQELGSKPAATRASTPQPPDKRHEIRQTASGKFVAQIYLQGELFETPCRDTEEEAQADRTKFEAELKRVKSLLSTKKSGHAHDEIVRAMKRFIDILSKRGAEGFQVVKLRDKFHAAVSVKGQLFSTPSRSTESEVRTDGKIAAEIIKCNPRADGDSLMRLIRMRFER